MSRQQLRPLPFLAPALALYAIFVLYPIAYAAFLSLHTWDGLSANQEFVGLRNYADLLFQDAVFWQALRNSAVWIALSLATQIPLGLLLALALNRRIPGRAAFRTVLYLPAILSTVSIALMWSWMYNPQLGLVNATLDALGLRQWEGSWLGEERAALLAVFVPSAWHALGLAMVLFLAGLQQVPQDHLEAAAVDGATARQTLWHITLPALRETLTIVVSVTVIGALKAFDLIYAMTYGGPGTSSQVLATWAYFQAFNFHKFGAGTALAMILLLLSLAIIVPYVRLMSRDPA